MQRSSDAELLKRSVADRQAFGVFYERHERAVLGFLGAATRSADLAADLTAETFAAALESVEQFDPERGSGRVWLFGIAHNVLASSARRGRVESDARRRLGMQTLAIEPEQIDAIAALIEREGDLIVDGWLQELPPDQALALRERVVNERRYEEIAAQLECSGAVVRQRVSRGLGRLRRRITKEAA